MSQPLSDYFAQEAGEFLDQLDALLARPDAPDAVRFFRLARGVRGSAQIAGVGGVAAVAERLEEAARSVRDGALPWSDEVRGRARQTLDDLRALVAAAPSWGADDEARAEAAAARWEGAGVPDRRRSEAAPAGDQLFAFLRREIVGVVAELDRVLSELARAPEAREPLRSVLRRMRPVRGVAGMDTLAPVLEVLEGIEDAAHEVLSRAGSVEARQTEVLGAGRDALAAAGRALESGAGLETAELERFREMRDRDGGGDAGEEAGVVPISRLFYDDGGPRVVSSPLAPAAEGGQASTLSGDVEGFLRIEATGFLDRAEGLIAGLSSRPQRFARAARQLADLAASVSDLAVTYGLTQLAHAAEQSAEHILRASQPEEARVALARLRASLPGGQALAGAAVEVEPEDDDEDEAPSPAEAVAAAADESGVVPVEALFYDAEGALREALEMRGRIAALAGEGTELGEALDELFALVELGLSQAAVRG